MRSNVYTGLALMSIAVVSFGLLTSCGGKPGRADGLWSSPRGDVRIEERIHDDGNATVGFYRSIWIERGEERERLALVRIGPKTPLVKECRWSGESACRVLIRPEAANPWSERGMPRAEALGVVITFDSPVRK